jgi:hypothetical protein
MDHCNTIYKKNNNCFETTYIFDASDINANDLSKYKDINQLNLYNKNVKIIIKINGKVKKMNKFKHDLKQYLNSLSWENIKYKNILEKIETLEYANCYRPDALLEYTDYLTLEKSGNETLEIPEKKSDQEYLELIEIIKTKLAGLKNNSFLLNHYDPHKMLEHQEVELIHFIQKHFLILNTQRLILFIKIITNNIENNE